MFCFVVFRFRAMFASLPFSLSLQKYVICLSDRLCLFSFYCYFSNNKKYINCNNTLCRPKRHLTHYMEQAFNVFSDMTDNGFPPTLATFNTLLHASASRGNIERANKVLRDMETTNITPDMVTFNIFLDVLANAQRITSPVNQRANIDRARVVIQQMTDQNMVPDSTTLNTYLSIVAEALFLRTAEEEVVGKMFSKYEVKPDRITYLILIRMLLRARRVERAWEMVKQMEKLGLGTVDGALAAKVAHACLGQQSRWRIGWEALSMIGVKRGERLVSARTTKQDSLRSMMEHQKQRVFSERVQGNLNEADDHDKHIESVKVWMAHLDMCIGCRKHYAKGTSSITATNPLSGRGGVEVEVD
eukprot:c10764_g1_i1.p1 GENE.c10764_g1_i1~~c10764_g1_i1.p1  ORF type:complete len:359 (-),score=94.72 c10764_g1_i1:180-1256(-)